MRAVQGGYYSIPGRMSTQDLADALGISDQAVTERLRRAIETLTENALISTKEEFDEEFVQTREFLIAVPRPYAGRGLLYRVLLNNNLVHHASKGSVWDLNCSGEKGNGV